MAEFDDLFDPNNPDDSSDHSDGAAAWPADRQAEQQAAARLSRLGWMASRDRTHRAIRRLRELLPTENFHEWVALTARTADAASSSTDAATPLDRLIALADPHDALSIGELATAIASPELVKKLAAPPSKAQPPSDALPPPAAGLATAASPAAAAALAKRLKPFDASPFAAKVCGTLRRRLSPRGFEELLAAIDAAAQTYPRLLTKYCDSGELEFTRELRGLLRKAWQTDDLTPEDVATLLDLGLVERVSRALESRATPRRGRR